MSKPAASAASIAARTSPAGPSGNSSTLTAATQQSSNNLACLASDRDRGIGPGGLAGDGTTIILGGVSGHSRS